jgi:hypothetical protein
MIDDDDDDIPSLFSFFEFKLKIIRVLDGMLIPSTIKFKAEFIAEDGDLDFTFRKIDFWLNNVVDHCIAFAHDDTTSIAMFIDDAAGKRRAGNVLMLTPNEPNDQHLAAIIQAKLQALSGTTVGWGPIEIKSDNDMGFRFTFLGNTDNYLPNMQQWVGERSYFDKPWWNRDDATTMDVLPPDDADLSVKPDWAMTLDFLKEPEQQSPSSMSNAKIVRAEFRPKIIDGGKTED